MRAAEGKAAIEMYKEISRYHALGEKVKITKEREKEREREMEGDSVLRHLRLP